MYTKVLGALSALGVVSWLLVAGVDGTTEPPQSSAIALSEVKSASKAAANVALPQAAITELVHQPQLDAPEVLEHLPRSLQGLPLPSVLGVDENGELRLDESVKNWFDFYLSAVGEQSLEEMVAKMTYQIHQQLPEPARSQAIELLQQYLSYRNQLAELMASDGASGGTSGSVERLALLNDAINSLRFALFDVKTVEAFFAKQMAYDHYMLARRKLAEQGLDSEQQALALAQLNANAPSWLLAQQRKSEAINQYRQKLAQGQSDTAKNYAAETFGVAAADRLAALEQKRQQWQQSLSHYQQAVSQLLLSNQLEGGALEGEVMALRERYFTKRDWLRVAAFDEQKFGLRLSF